MHYLTEHWEMRERILSSEPFFEAKTAENIRKAVLRVVSTFDITVADSALVFVTYQGAHFVSAFGRLRDSAIVCACHVINTVLKHAFDEKSHPENNGILQVIK